MTCTTEQSRHSTPTVEEDTSTGQTAGEIPDCSVVHVKRQHTYRSREERGYVEATYYEIGAELGVSHTRARQIEREALRKFRLAYENLMRVKQVNYKWVPGEEDE